MPMFNEKPVGIGRKQNFCTLPIRVSCLSDPPLPDVLKYKINNKFNNIQDMNRKEWILNNRQELIEKRTIPELKMLDIIKNETHFKIEVQKHIQCGNKIYFVDIFIPKIKVAIEVDGSSHNDKTELDMFRDMSMARKGIMTFRISNKDVYNKTAVDAFLSKIRKFATAKKTRKIRKHTDILRIICDKYGNIPVYLKSDA